MQKSIKKNRWSRKKIITCSIIGAIVVAAAVTGFTLTKNNALKSSSAGAQRTTKVTKGNIEVSISGSGTITSANTSDLMSNVEGKIIKAYFKEGDTVKEGDLLYEIDDNDAQLNIQKIENSISQAKLSSGSNDKKYDSLVITAPFDGRVTDIQAEKGESVNSGKSLFTITDTSKLTISVPFSKSDVQEIKVGQKVQINLQQQFDTIEGVVTEIADNTYTASNGGIVKNVEVTVTNPGTLTDSSTASVSLTTAKGAEITSQDVGIFSYANKKTVQAATSGEFSAVNIKENQYVKKDDVLIKIDNDDLQVTTKTNDLKMQDLQNQLSAAKKTLEDYKVYAPFDGTISSITAEQGDSLERGGALLSIRDFNQMQFTISVDELDISKVEVGQDVSVTVDALTETTADPLSGKVIYKAMEGASSNGVATYDVTIKINETENLLAGMNANATITLDKAENALVLPLEAVSQRGSKSFVWVKSSSSGGNQQAQTGEGKGGSREASGSSDNAKKPDAGTGEDSKNTQKQNNGNSEGTEKMPTVFSQNQEYYANAEMVSVEVGLTSDTYIEIKSGLSEGDEVILPPLVESSNGESSEQKSSGGFNMGGMSGGMSGGMPSGGGGMPGGGGGMPSGDRTSSGSRNR
ncbi:HlyD family secretion protein [Ruminiclostridium sufflavum DSM 19573]|uniref:HlyD family secretion protein n=1 Tax=Ruminiclostridium sufflavum DSM 19573 TaxID=1121337 RepID=A0A318XP88_9FIRM|nr:HlyD family efflux transporter periplasmic adaptor subunit [Ruminiclostridium sufflavum]PYG88750.1 HlyD family secretion protein [Ruminiclostridium sufflavum DSM 19573]